VRVENLPTPADYIPRVMEKVRPLYLQRTYEIASWTDPIDFLTKLAIRSGKLLRVPSLGSRECLFGAVRSKQAPHTGR
jgi:hypothetical protein